MKLTNTYGRNFGRTATHEQINNLLKLMENKMNQTAVEWLEEKAKEFSIDLDLLNYFEQAKQMEKKQIIDAVDDWVFNGTKKGEQYYNETYGE